MTWASAGRKLSRQVRAARKPARCAASCTESEKAISFLSALKREPNSCCNTTADRLAACEPTMESVLLPSQNGQSWLEYVSLAPLRVRWRRLAVISTSTSVDDRLAVLSWQVQYGTACACSAPHNVHTRRCWKTAGSGLRSRSGNADGRNRKRVVVFWAKNA